MEKYALKRNNRVLFTLDFSKVDHIFLKIEEEGKEARLNLQSNRARNYDIVVMSDEKAEENKTGSTRVGDAGLRFL